MNVILCLALFACAAPADESGDRAAIERVIAALNPPAVTHPTIEISHEPWGEATIWLPGSPNLRALLQLRVRMVLFLTPEVALVDVRPGYPSARLFFVLKKEDGDWRIARRSAVPVATREFVRPLAR